MIIKELIIQQYSSYDKSTGYCNLHLDGNLNATLHSICVDIAAIKTTNRTHKLHVHFTITRPALVNGLDIMEQMIERLCKAISTDKVTLTIQFLQNIGYRKSASENRKNCHEIIAGLFLYRGSFMDQFDSLETHFENTLTHKYCTTEILKWKSGKNSLGRNRNFYTRLNISKHSFVDPRTFLSGYESGIAALASISNGFSVQNQQQIDYIKSYCIGFDPRKFAVGTRISYKDENFNFLFSGTLFEIQNSFFRIKDTEVLAKLTDFFNDQNIKYFFPFRLSDPDWGYDRLSDAMKQSIIVTNPTNTPLERSSLQIEFDKIMEGYDDRQILTTMYYLMGINIIDIRVPLYSDIFNILHQTTAELFYFCPKSILYCFDRNGEHIRNYETRVRNLTYENVM